MALRILFFQTGDARTGPERELSSIREAGKAGVKDEGRLRAAIANCWTSQGFDCGQLSFCPIEGAPYEKKLWEARYLKTARSDGVHGYRLFYMLARDPAAPAVQVVVVLMVWGKSGPKTPTEVLATAWARYLVVEDLLAKGKFF